MKPKVKLLNVSKVYSLYRSQADKFLDLLLLNRGKKKEFYALKEVSFEVYEGETIGVVGINGSGKSTLSNILAQVAPPTTGEVVINGETSLIAISAGLNNQLSGLANIELKCLMHGLSKDEIKELTPKIIDFADLGHFIEQPIKNYSSGMKARLGFAISVIIKPDILIVDEALSVGDQTFYEKCLEKFNEFKASGKTIFFISHSLQQIRSLSDGVLWLHHGEVKGFGKTDDVLGEYETFISWFNQLSEIEKKAYKNEMVNQQCEKKIRKKRRTNENRNSLMIYFQITLLFIATIISALFMIKDQSPFSYFEKGQTEVLQLVEQGEKEQVDQTIEMNEEGKLNKVDSIGSSEINLPGVVKVRSVNIFDNLEQSSIIASVNFGTSLHVLERIGDLFKVKFNNHVGFISVNKVELIELNETSGLSILDLYPIFQEGFSYEYFLSHLNVEYDTIADRMSGITFDGIDEHGMKVLSLSSYHVMYNFNKENIAEELMIGNVNLDRSFLNQVIEHAKVSSEDGNLFFVLLDNYEVIFDLIEESLIIKYLTENTSY